MNLRITEQTVDKYRTGTHPDTTKLIWRAGKLDADVLRNFPNLELLDCADNGLTSLEGLDGCPQILELRCDKNNLRTLTGLKACPLVVNLHCYCNQLETLEGIENCQGLLQLICYKNRLTNMKHITYCPVLHTVYCFDNRLTSLMEIQSCPQLRRLRCGGNLFHSFTAMGYCDSLQALFFCGGMLSDLDGLDNFPNLLELVCYRNDLTSLDGLGAARLLQNLDCSSNKICSLRGIEHCDQLCKFDICSNEVTSITEIQSCSQLRELRCAHNMIRSIDGIEGCPLIELLYCSNNRLFSLDKVRNCRALCNLSCSRNNIKSFEPLVYLPRLTALSYYGNPLDIQTIQVQRLLTRLDRARTVGDNSSIYDDRQNVHNVRIQQTVCESIQRLLRDPKPNFTIDSILRSSLPGHTKQVLIEYCTDESVHSEHLITYIELLGHVWARIERSEHREELFKILAEQVADSECKCFTGRINRTLSVLVGFDADIIIEISDNARISAIILTIKAKINPYDPDTHREQALTALTAAGYDTVTIQPWIDAIE